MALVEKGVSPDEAWAQTKDLINAGATWGTWWKDEYVSEPKDDLDAHGVRGRVHTHLLHPDDVCDRHVIRGVLQELDSVVLRARMFQHKPNDEVMLHKTDVNGTPIPADADAARAMLDAAATSDGPVSLTLRGWRLSSKSSGGPISPTTMMYERHAP